MSWSDAAVSDAVLADGATADVDTDAQFAAFVRNHGELVYRVARQMMSSHEEADDVVQEAFLRAFRGLPGYRGAASIETWLYRIVMNVAQNTLRHRARRQKLAEAIRHHTVPLHHTARSPIPVEFDEARAQVWAALNALSAEHRAVVVLFDLEGLSCQQVSTVLDIPEGTVRSRLYHGRRRMRTRLTPYFEHAH